MWYAIIDISIILICTFAFVVLRRGDGALSERLEQLEDLVENLSMRGRVVA